jgi:hypothetical protein
MGGTIKHRAGAGVLFAFLAAFPAATYGQAHEHRAFTAAQPGTATDTARALEVVRRLRAATAQYQTLEDAEAAGYMPRQRADRVKPNGVLHVGRVREWGERPRPFDLSEPQVLLYRRAADGSMRLAGVMLVAPRDATGADLDAVIPRSVAPWHRHVNVCGTVEDGMIRRFPGIATAEACSAAGGRFRAETRYMIHVMTTAGDDLAAIFPQGHGMEGMEGMQAGMGEP